jgi:acylphosphatase
MEEVPVRLNARVEGHVQGVGFRAYVQQSAQLLKLNGYVRNTYHGDVEVVAEGTRQSLESLLEDLRHGPRGAHVINVWFKWEDASGKYTCFTILSMC